MPRAAIVVFDRFQALDAFGPLEVLAGAGYEVELVARRAGPVRASNGSVVLVETALDDLPGPIDTLLVTGGQGTRHPTELADVASLVAAHARRAGRVASVCTGAFVLAEAGLLDGKRCTTHWHYSERLAAHYPSVILEPDSIYVRDGAVWTSAGVTAGIDLALALVEEDRGSEVARQIARHLVVYLQRPGGQHQFSAPMAAQCTSGATLRDLVAWIREHLDADCSVAALARRAGMSQRSLARAFRTELDTTPASLVEQCRIEAARQLLETTDLTVAAIARQVGIGTPETLHRAFSRRVHVTPADYRARFRGRVA
jgi:transcriptional regulator GlxA family with amidase domain